MSLLISGSFTALLSVIVFSRVKDAGRSFGWILLTIAIWVLAYGVELSSHTLPYVLLSTYIQYIGISLLPACWIIFVIKFIGKEEWLHKLNLSLIFSIPMLTLCLVWTNGWHHLHYLQVSLERQEIFSYLLIKPGPWYWLHTGYFYVMLALGSYLMMRTYNKANAVYRKQNIIILIGVLTPWMFNMLYLLNIRPMHIDLTPYGFIVTAAVISFGLLKFKFLHILPIAREKIIEAMQEGVLVLDPDNKVVDYNAQLIFLFAIKTPDIIGANLEDLFPAQVKLHQLAKSKISKSIELAVCTSGNTWYYEVNSRILSGENNLYKGLLLLFRDITEQRKAQQRAESAFHLLTGVLDSSLSAVVAFRAIRDRENTIIDFECIACNQQAVVAWSPYADTLVGKNLLQLLPFVKQDNLFEKYIGVVEKGETLEREISLLAGEKVIWLQVTAIKLSDGFTGNFTDITGRKQAEKMLESSKANLSALIENTSDLIWSIDSNYQFMTINSSFKYSYSLISGYEPRVGDHVKNIKLPYPQAKHWKNYLARAFNGEAFSAETEINTQFGIQIFESSLNPIRSRQGKVEGITVFSRNITQRKEAEREILLAREAAENANSFKTRFLANITHEIRTPINAIIGFSEVLQKQTLSAEQKEYVNYILSAGDTLLKLIGDVLDLTKIEQGKMSIEKESFHLKQMLTSAIDPYKFRAEERGLSFHLSFSENLPVHLIGDGAKLCQIVINLLGNALKFTEQGGICVSFKCQRDTGSGTLVVPANQIILQINVSDTGIGIPPDQQERIFQSFTQADASISRRYGGSGLGLSIIREMVYLMGGHLQVISPSIASSTGCHGGPGSTFQIHLPLEIDVCKPVIAEHTSEPSGKINYRGQVTVLIVEDNPVNQRLAYLILQETGCQIVVANNGAEALVELANQKIDIIFMDLQMRVMDGYTAAATIRLTNQHIPIIGLSANVYREDIDHCYQVGMNDYLGKPYNAEKLVNKLQKWASQSSAALAKQPLIQPTDETLPAVHYLLNSPATSDSNQAEEQTSSKYRMDLTALEKFTDGILSEMKEMAEAILKLDNELLDALDGWLIHQEKAQLSASAHKIKGCLYLIGLDNLREPIQQLEAQCREAGRENQLSELCLQLKPIFVTARQELEAYLATFQKNLN